MSLESELAAEIEKWSRRLDEALPGMKGSDDVGGRMLQNINAYRNDSRHFLERGELVKSFECLVWAWAILELGRELGILRSE
jgi:hypothetical protein